MTTILLLTHWIHGVFDTGVLLVGAIYLLCCVRDWWNLRGGALARLRAARAEMSRAAWILEMDGHKQDALACQTIALEIGFVVKELEGEDDDAEL